MRVAEAAASLGLLAGSVSLSSSFSSFSSGESEAESISHVTWGKQGETENRE